jgi:phosphatidate cytidylyltransferase
MSSRPLLPNLKAEKDAMDDKHLNLTLRICSSLILIPLVLLAIYSTEIVFSLSVTLIAGLMAMEWHGLVKQHRSHKVAWWAAGSIYVLVFAGSLVKLRYLPGGSGILLWLLVTVWTADTAAFICGLTFGGTKLAPKISPAKTWSGFCGALLASVGVGVLLSQYMHVHHDLIFIFVTAGLGVISQASDLLESWIKRKAGIKDSGSFIPGHGGILDRTDSLVLTAPALLLLLMLFKDFLI